MILTKLIEEAYILESERQSFADRIKNGYNRAADYVSKSLTQASPVQALTVGGAAGAVGGTALGFLGADELNPLLTDAARDEFYKEPVLAGSEIGSIAGTTLAAQALKASYGRQAGRR